MSLCYKIQLSLGFQHIILTHRTFRFDAYVDFGYAGSELSKSVSFPSPHPLLHHPVRQIGTYLPLLRGGVLL